MVLIKTIDYCLYIDAPIVTTVACELLKMQRSPKCKMKQSSKQASCSQM